MLHVALFGTPQFKLGNRALDRELTGRVLALFTFLAVTGRVHDRGILADLLWDEISEHQAKTNLRYVLYDLRQIVGDYLTGVQQMRQALSRSAILLPRNPGQWLPTSVLRSDGGRWLIGMRFLP